MWCSFEVCVSREGVADLPGGKAGECCGSWPGRFCAGRSEVAVRGTASVDWGDGIAGPIVWGGDARGGHGLLGEMGVLGREWFGGLRSSLKYGSCVSSGRGIAGL